MNDTVRVQDNHIKSIEGHSGRGPSGLDCCFIRLQTSSFNETYDDGHIDYVHEL